MMAGKQSKAYRRGAVVLTYTETVSENARRIDVSSLTTYLEDNGTAVRITDAKRLVDLAS